MKEPGQFKKFIATRLAAVAALLIVAALIFVASSNSSKPFASVEVAFTDSSAHGMQIMPASCPSDPFDVDAPYGCSGSTPLCPDGVTLAPNANVSECSCAEGNTSACNNSNVLCPDGVTPAPNGDISQCTCAEGNELACTQPTPPATGTPPTIGGGGGLTQNGTIVSACAAGYTVVGNECIFTGCPTGYAEETDSSGNPECVFRGCPSGYLQQGNMCIQDQCVQGLVCGADGNLYLEDASCNEVLDQACAYGCSNNACYFPPSSATVVAAPSIVKAGETSQISWRAENVKSCTVTGTNGDSWGCSASACDATTTEQSGLIQAQTTYTLSCTALDSSSLGGSAVVDIVPDFVEH